MTILTEREREMALLYYGYGWSFQEITQRILEVRNQAIKTGMTEEVAYVVAHRFSKKVSKND